MKQVTYVKKSDAVTRGEGTDYKIENYITKDVCESVSLAVSSLNGTIPTTINKRSDRIYYFIEGYANFTFEDQIIEAKEGSVIFIPSNTRYTMSGRFKAVLVNSPAFSVADEVHSIEEI